MTVTGAEPPARFSSRAAAAAIAAAVAVVVGGAAWIAVGEVGRRPAFDLGELPSYWNEVPIRCRTTILPGAERREVFRCRPTGTGRLLPGRYDESETEWFSDLDGRLAARHEIVVTPAGVVSGWASYPGGRP